MNHKYIKQDGLRDCGVFCLYNIIRYYKGNIDIDKLREYCNVTKKGMSIYDLVNASKKVGLQADAFRCEFKNLSSVHTPFVAHIKVNTKYNHFIIVTSIKNNFINVFDPIRGIIKYSKEDFLKEWTNIVILFNKTNYIVHDKNKNYFKKIISLLKNNIRPLRLIIVLSFVITFLEILSSFFFSEEYININSHYKVFILFILLVIFKCLISYLRNIKLIKFNKMFDYKITYTSLKKILFLPYKFHHNRPVGDIILRLNDLSNIKNFIYEFSFSIVVHLFFIIIVIIFTLFINIYLFILILSFGFIYLCFNIVIRRRINDLISLLKNENANVNSKVTECILGIDTIKNYMLESIFLKDFKKYYNTFLNFNYNFNKKYSRISLVNNLIIGICNIILVFISVNLYKNNIISIQYMLAFNSVIIYYFISLEKISNLDYTFINAKEAYKRIDKLVSRNLTTNASKYKFNFNNNIKIRNLNYKYLDYKNINLNIEKGKFILITGDNGIGKSSLVNILNKNVLDYSGDIYIDGVDIKDISKDEIKKHICLVSQNEYLFNESILENIKFYKDVDNNKLLNSLYVSRLCETLKYKKIDLDYIVEENGVNLSGGERKKIIITRALYNSNDILIFDETTNEIDVETERKIFKGIRERFDLTVIVISHRLNNKDLFDEIVNLERVK